MATRTWNSAGSTDMNDGANYDGSGALLSTDDLVFDATSLVNATATADLSVASITTTADYSGNWHTGGFTITTTGAMSFDHTGSLDLRGPMSIGTGGWHIGSGVGAVNCTGSSFTFTADGALDLDKIITFGAVTLSAGVTVTHEGAVTACLVSTSTAIPLTLGANAVFTANQTLGFRTSNNVDLISLDTDAVINGTGMIIFRATAGASATMPAFTYSGTGSIRFDNAGATAAVQTITLTGALNVGTNNLELLHNNNNVSSGFTFNTGNYSITCGQFRPGNNTVNGTFELNLGSSEISCTSITNTWNNTAASNFNLQTAQITCTGSITIGSNWTINVGASIVNITSPSSRTITCNGKTPFNDLYVDCGGGVLTFGDDWAIAGDITTVAGSITWAGYTGTVAGDAIFDNTGLLIMGVGLVLNGASATFHIGAGVGSISGLTCTFTFNGTTGMIFDLDKSTVLGPVVLGTNAVVTFGGDANYWIAQGATPLTLGDGASLTLNKPLYADCDQTAAAYSFVGTYTLNGSSVLYVRAKAHNITVTLPAITITGLLQLRIGHGGAYTGVIYDQAGTLTTSTTLNIVAYHAGSVATYNTNDHIINVTGNLYVGGLVAGTITYNFGSSDVNITVGLVCTSASTTHTLNFQTSHWTTRYITLVSDTVVNPGTSLFTLSGGGGQITCAGKTPFYDLTIDNVGNTITFLDDWAIDGDFVVIEGDVSWAGFTATIGMDCIIDGTGTITIGNGLTCNGNTASVHFGSTLGVVTGSTSCVLTLNGTTGMTIDDDKSMIFKSWVLGANAKVTSSGDAATSLIGPTSLLTFGDSASLTISRNIILRPTAAQTVINFLGAYTFNGTFPVTFQGDCDDTVIIPALTWTGTGACIIRINSSKTMTWELGGNYSWTGGKTTIYKATTGHMTFDTKNYNMSLQAFDYGSSNTSDTFTISFGSSTITATTVNGSVYNNATITVNKDSSQWTISGNYTTLSNATYNPGTSTLTMTGLNAVLATNGKSVGKVIANNSIAINNSCTLPGLSWGVDGKTITFEAGETFTITNLSAEDWNGIDGSLNSLVSSSPGTAYTIAIPDSLSVSYMNPTDCHISGGTVTPQNSIDGGGNVNWIFLSAVMNIMFGMNFGKYYAMN
jgi:hypothetical protein